MATLECDMCDDENATYILTNIDSGETARVGVMCFPSFIMSIAEGIVAASASDENDSDQIHDEVDPKPSGRSPRTASAVATHAESVDSPTKVQDEHPAAAS
jgi:hypothetical protein